MHGTPAPASRAASLAGKVESTTPESSGAPESPGEGAASGAPPSGGASGASPAQELQRARAIAAAHESAHLEISLARKVLQL